MCGIVGIFDPQRRSSSDLLGRQAGDMATALAHRGPDDEGTWVDPDGRVVFGHRRLSVVDLSPEGHQPMLSADGRWASTYNGEIYNFGAMRRRLVSEGLPLRGGSDTEVLWPRSQCWGLARALDASEGMFALAVWDRQQSPTASGAGPIRREAALLRVVGRPSGLRLRAEGLAPPARTSTPT